MGRKRNRGPVTVKEQLITLKFADIAELERIKKKFGIPKSQQISMALAEYWKTHNQANESKGK